MCISSTGSVEALLMPFERIQTLLADSMHHEKFQNTRQAFQYVYVNYGYRELFRGATPVLWRNGPSNALFFIMREEAARHLPHHVRSSRFLYRHKWLTYFVLFQNDTLRRSIQEFMSGAFIGAFLSSLFYPANVVKVAMQTTIGGPNPSIIGAFRHVYRERGSKLRNVYKGVGINCSRAFLSWGIINVSYEGIKRLFFQWIDSIEHGYVIAYNQSDNMSTNGSDQLLMVTLYTARPREMEILKGATHERITISCVFLPLRRCI